MQKLFSVTEMDRTHSLIGPSAYLCSHDIDSQLALLCYPLDPSGNLCHSHGTSQVCINRSPINGPFFVAVQWPEAEVWTTTKAREAVPQLDDLSDDSDHCRGARFADASSSMKPIIYIVMLLYSNPQPDRKVNPARIMVNYIFIFSFSFFKLGVGSTRFDSW